MNKNDGTPNFRTGLKITKEQNKHSSARKIASAPNELKLNKSSVYFIPLGGVGEFGLNCSLYHCDGKWILVDMGISFDDLVGINVFVPKINFLKNIPQQDFLGIVITHGHEDHLGAVQYLWSKFKNVTIYGTPFTTSLLKYKINDMNSRKLPNIVTVQSREIIDLGPFKIQWAFMTHSIPDSAMLMIRTKYGNVLHTGDWRFDSEPVIGDRSDIETLAQFGREGNVIAAVGDSTHAMTEGSFKSEKEVKSSIQEIVASIKKGRVIIVCFSTNLARVDSCARIGVSVGRQVSLFGRSLRRMEEVGKENGYLQDLPEFVKEIDASKIKRDNLLIVCSGSQGEPRSALRRFADNEHPKLNLERGDTVIISARMITGKERDVHDMLNNFAKMGINVITTKHDANIHVSGHPPQEDLRKLYSLVKPKTVVPVHGEMINLAEHKKFAESMGISSVIIENGDVLDLNTGRTEGKVKCGQLGLDGKVLVPIDGKVVQERQSLQTGCVFVSVAIHPDHSFTKEIAELGTCENHEYNFIFGLNELIHKTLDKTVPASLNSLSQIYEYTKQQNYNVNLASDSVATRTVYDSVYPALDIAIRAYTYKERGYNIPKLILLLHLPRGKVWIDCSSDFKLYMKHVGLHSSLVSILDQSLSDISFALNKNVNKRQPAHRFIKSEIMKKISKIHPDLHPEIFISTNDSIQKIKYDTI